MLKMTKSKFIISVIIIGVIGGVFWWIQSRPRTYEHIEKQSVLRINKIEQKVVTGSYKMRVKLPLNNEVTIKYIVPIGQDGLPLKTASNMIFYAPYNGEHGDNFERHSWLIAFPVEFGYSIFSMSMKADKEITGDRNKYYIYPEAGWYEIIAEVQKKLMNDFLLTNHPLIVVGQSSGGSLIQQMVAAKPEWIDIAAWCGGSRYCQWTEPNRTAILALSTWGCYGTDSTDAMAKNLTEIKGVLLQTYTPLLKAGDYHSVGTAGQRLMQLFVRDMVKLRETNNGLMPSPKSSYTQLSEEFRTIWNTMPHNLLCESAKDYSELKIFPMLPQNLKQIIWIMTENNSTTKNLGIILESFAGLSKQDSIVIWNKFDDTILNAPKIAEQILTQILMKSEWKNLPLYVVGNGLGGQAVAVASLNNKSNRIKGIMTLDSAYECHFEQLSIAQRIFNTNIPMIMCFSGSFHDALPINIIAKSIGQNSNSSVSKNWQSFMDIVQSQIKNDAIGKIEK